MRFAQLLLPLALLGCGDKEDLIEDTGPPAKTIQKPAPPPSLIELPADQQGLVAALSDGKTAEPALAKLVEMGPTVIGGLQDLATHGTDIGARGWAIQGLSRIEDPAADTALQAILVDAQSPELVRTWAAAARVARAQNLDQVLALAPLASSFPALKRPIAQKVEAYQGQLGDVGGALVAMGNDPTLQAVLAPAVIARGATPLLKVMFTHENNEARRLAAAFLGTLGQQDNKAIPQIAAAYAFDPRAQAIPWKGGALYVPQLSWDRKEAREIVRGLIAWHLYCDRKQLSAEQQQIFNNLQSVGLHRAVNFDWPQNDTRWLLAEWAKKQGSEDAFKMLEEQGVNGVQAYVDAIAKGGH